LGSKEFNEELVPFTGTSQELDINVPKIKKLNQHQMNFIFFFFLLISNIKSKFILLNHSLSLKPRTYFDTSNYWVI